MLIVAGTFRAPPANLAAARSIMATMITASRAEDGCQAYAYAEDMLEPGLIRVFEAWRDRAALERHFATPHIAAWRGAWPALGIGERALSSYEAADPTPV
jgi:quinol monooxygenase YgiN